MNNELQNAIQLEKDLIIEKYKMSLNHRLEKLFRIQNKIYEEIETRKLNTISTSKLIDLCHQTHSTINKELRPVEINEKNNCPNIEMEWVETLEI